jgi:hypothetical protein
VLFFTFGPYSQMFCSFTTTVSLFVLIIQSYAGICYGDVTTYQIHPAVADVLAHKNDGNPAAHV